jgi:general secretion pathway protein D
VAGALTPGVPAAVITPTTTNLVAAAAGEPVELQFQVAPLDQVLDAYSLYTGRTVLRPAALPQVSVTLRSARPLPKEEAVQALESVLALNGVSLINVGEKFVTAVQTQQALMQGAAFSKMEGKDLAELGQFVTKMVRLTNALPSEVAQAIQTFGQIQGGVVPIDSTMTLVLRDYPANIKRMLEIIEKVDVTVESDYKLEVIPIKFGKVEEIYATMSSLIGGGGGGAPAAAGQLGTRRQTGARGGMGGRGTGLSGSRSNYRQAGSYQQRSGTYGGYGGYGGSGGYGGQVIPQAVQTTPVGGVGGGAASTFNQRLQGVINRMSGGGEPQLLGDAKIIPDERSNSLIVFATKEDMKMITNIVSKVDRLLAQVLIEAIIMDVELNNSLEFGVSALMRPQQTGKLTSAAGSFNGQSFLSGITNLGSGGNLPSGFSYFGRYAGDLDVAVKALAANGRGEILATPRVQTSHATPANFTVGQSVPYVTSTYYGGYGYGPSAQLQQLDVETTLDVTPYITPDGLVVMEIQQNIEEITGYTDIANVGKMPNTTRRAANATVSVQDRDTIVLGGYIRASKSNSKSGVPVLKDIPGLGAMFRSTSKETKRTELLVLLRPTVLPSPREAAESARAERERMPGIREMEQDWKKQYDELNEKADKRSKKR